MKITMFDNPGLGEIPHRLLKGKANRDYHVHAPDCGDCSKYNGPGRTLEAESPEDLAEFWYEDIIAEQGGSGADYLGEFYFAPCVKF
jgi:hypothetical protein